MADTYEDSWYGVPSYQPVYQQVQTPTYEPLTLGRAISMVREIQNSLSPQRYGDQAASFDVPASANVPNQVRQNMFTGPVSYPRAWLRNNLQQMQQRPYTPTVNDIAQQPNYSGGGGSMGSYGFDDYTAPSLNTTRTTTSSLSPTKVSSGSRTTTTPSKTTTLTHEPGSNVYKPPAQSVGSTLNAGAAQKQTAGFGTSPIPTYKYTSPYGY